MFILTFPSWKKTQLYIYYSVFYLWMEKFPNTHTHTRTLLLDRGWSLLYLWWLSWEWPGSLDSFSLIATCLPLHTFSQYALHSKWVKYTVQSVSMIKAGWMCNCGSSAQNGMTTSSFFPLHAGISNIHHLHTFLKYSKLSMKVCYSGQWTLILSRVPIMRTIGGSTAPTIWARVSWNLLKFWYSWP